MSHTAKDGSGNLVYVRSLGAGTVGDPLELTTMPRGQVCIELGNAYQSAKRYTIANNGTLDILLKTPASSKVIMTKLAVDTSAAPLEMDLREDVIVSANGTAITMYNLNRQSSNAASSLLYQSPTVTDTGTPIVEMELNGDKDFGGSGARDCGMILDASTSYLIRINNTSGAAATMAIDIRISEL